MDPSKTGRETARQLKRLLDGIEFPASRHDVVSHIGDETISIGSGNVIRPAEFLREAPEDEFTSRYEVAERLVLMGAIRARGHEAGDVEENRMPGHEGEHEGYASSFSNKPAAGAEEQSMAPPVPPSETKGVRRPIE